MRETEQEHAIRMMMPPQVRRKCSVTLSIREYLCRVERLLTGIYGERANLTKNLERFEAEPLWALVS